MSLRWLRQRWKRRVWLCVRHRVRPLAAVAVDDFRLTVDLKTAPWDAMAEPGSATS